MEIKVGKICLNILIVNSDRSCPVSIFCNLHCCLMERDLCSLTRKTSHSYFKDFLMLWNRPSIGFLYLWLLVHYVFQNFQFSCPSGTFSLSNVWKSNSALYTDDLFGAQYAWDSSLTIYNSRTKRTISTHCCHTLVPFCKEMPFESTKDGCCWTILRCESSKICVLLLSAISVAVSQGTKLTNVVYWLYIYARSAWRRRPQTFTCISWLYWIVDSALSFYKIFEQNAACIAEAR